MKSKQIGGIILFNSIFGLLFIGLILETIRDGYHWIFIVLAAILIGCVNATIFLDQRKEKNNE